MSAPVLDTALLLAYRQCPRRAHLHRRRESHPHTSLERHVADLRFQVLARVRALYGDAVDPTAAGAGAAPRDQARATAAATAAGHALWGPRFRCRDHGATLRAGADLALPAPGGWVLAVVAVGARIKSHHITTLALAWHAAELGARRRPATGLNVVGARVIHIDRGAPAAQAAARFAHEDVTERVRAERAGLQAVLEAMARAARHDRDPETPIGRHCERPAPCPYRGRCWAPYGGRSVFDVPGLDGRARTALAAAGWLRVEDVPRDTDLLSAAQRRSLALVRERRVEVDRPALARALARLEPPLAYLDIEFETAAIPRWPAVRPHQAVPFAFDLRLPGAHDGPRHHRYLARPGEDPRPALAAALAAALEGSGSVVVYDAAAERSILRALAEDEPAWAGVLLPAAARTWDLLEVVRRCVRHHAFGSGLSLRRVSRVLAPATDPPPVAGEARVADGLGAQVAWRRLGAGPDARAAARAGALQDYVARDTQAMVAVLERLRAWSAPRAHAAGPAAT